MKTNAESNLPLEPGLEPAVFPVTGLGTPVCSPGMPDARNPQRSNPPASPHADLPPLPDSVPGAVAVPANRQREALDFLHHEGAGQDHAAPTENVTIPGGTVTITESAEALFRAIAPRKQLFYRGGVVVELVNEGEGYTVQVLDAVAAQSRFEKYVWFFKNVKAGEGFTPARTTINELTAKQYLKSRSSRTSVGEFGCFLGLGSELN
jgi:hypothetical protein